MDTVPDDVVISGVGGYFPKAVNIEEFKNLLLENKVLIEPRWPDDKNVCNKIGAVNADYFDNSYFGIHRQQCSFMDPMHRLALERAFEAVIDAGLNPSEMRGKRIGVFMGSTIGENDKLFVESVVSGFGVTGHSRAMLANRISYWLNLKGPSVAYDANWISGMEVLRLAYYAIKTGQCDSVIIGTTNLAQHLDFQQMYNELGLLSRDGSTKAFDKDASGYARSDGVVVMLIQKSSEARRIYASVMNVATKFDGTTPGNFMNVETESMVKFLEEFYKNSKVKPEEIQFVEAYGCGLKKIDKCEVDALEKIYCKNRSKPLLIGSVKTVAGHSEPTAALFSIVKTIVAMETDTIPATLQFTDPNPEIQALNNGKVKVVTSNTSWEPKYAAVNALATSAYFGHVILRANPKKKVPKQLDLPVLLLASTRTEEGMAAIIETLKKKPKDAEYHKLLHDVFKEPIKGHLYRGYLLKGEDDAKSEIINHMGHKRPIWFIYSGMGSQWNEMLGDFMKIEIFAESIRRSHDILAKKGVDLMNILTSPDKTIFDNILHCFVGIAAIQIALTDVLTALGIVPDGIIGHSVGELGCAYADGCLTAEQMILSSYSRGRASLEATLIKGMMAAIGLGYNQIKDKLPESIEVACHNGPDSCTISGPTEDMEKFVEKLKKQGTFARLVNVANIAYHSRYIKPAAPLLLKYLKEVIPKPTLRSSKWVTTSNQESNWDSDVAKYSSAEYHTNNLLSSVLFEEGIKHIPKDSVLIEIAPHGLLQAILKRSVKECFSIPLTQRGTKSTTEFLFQNLGKMYLSGLDLKLANIYPKIEYPVSRNTSSLADLVHWNHADNWSRREEAQSTLIGVRNIDVGLYSEEFSDCKAHKIYDQVVIPISVYLNIVLQITENAFGGYAVIFENILFKKPVVIPAKGVTPINVMVQHGSGIFEVFSGDELAVSGKITVVEDSNDMVNLEEVQVPVNKESVKLSGNDLYNELDQRGYKYDGRFKHIKNLISNQNGSNAAVTWNNKWDDLIESMIQQQLFHVGERNQDVYLPRHIQKIVMCHSLLPTTTDVNISFEYASRTLSAPGIEIYDMKTKPFQRKILSTQLNSVDLIPLDDIILSNIEDGIEQALQLTVNNFKEPNIPKLYISEVETDHLLQKNINTVIHNTAIDVNSTLVKEARQVAIIESFPQLLIKNDKLSPDIIKSLCNSESAFLLAKQHPDENLDNKVSVVSRFRFGQDHYVICRKASNPKGLVISIKEQTVSIKDFQKKSTSWAKELVNSAKRSFDQQIPILLETSSIPTEGFINFIQAVRTVPYMEHVRIFYNHDQSPGRANEALKRNLAVTILKDKRWFTYLPMSLKLDENKEETKSPTPIIENKLISYIGLNLKDETITPELKNKNEIGNIDYCGVSKTGQRVMGLAYLDKESSKLVVDDILTWEVPEKLSLEDAITIPHAYASAFYMMVVKGRLKHGDTVLIHKGCSPIGLAAISVAYSYGCKIFTTVATNRQKVYLKKTFMFLHERNILDSNSVRFETEIMSSTGGRGVELLLNCVSGALLKSSVACMAEYGKFIQYGKYDLEEGNSIGMSVFLKNVDLYHVDLHKVFLQEKEIKQEIRNLISNGIQKYVVRPLRKEIITHHNISAVMKKLESPQIIGKIVIDAVNNLNVNKLNVKDPNRFICNSKYSYLIVGGSAATWIYIAEWLVHRGARKIVICSDNKPTETYLNRKLTILENYYNADIIMASGKVDSKNTAVQLMSEVANLGSLHAVFMLPNGNASSTQQEETVEILDSATRIIAPKTLFVNFINSARGICYKRAESGYPTKNIQFSNQEEIDDIVPSLDLILHSNFVNLMLKKHAMDSADDNSKSIISDLTKLIPNIEDILHLQKNAPNEPELVQVVTEGPTEIRELDPVFIIPGITGYKELETFVRNLMYPAFCAVLPSKPWQLEKLAQQYAQKIIEVYPKGVYNIVSISSGGPLAIEIARVLAKRNASLHLFFIDSAPQRVQQGLQDLGDDTATFELNFLKTAFEINDSEILKQLKNTQNFEKRIQILLQLTDQSEKNKILLTEGLIAAKDFIKIVKSFKPSKDLVPGKIHLLVPDNCSEYDNYGLTSYCQNPPVTTKVFGDHLNIIKQRDTHEYVNQNHCQS